MIHKRDTGQHRKLIVTFEIPGTIWAERINLVGDFNNWDYQSLPFRRTRDGNWKIEVEPNSGCDYRFRYLMDGVHWRYDWHADKHVLNSQGGYDSIVVAEVLSSTSIPLINRRRTFYRHLTKSCPYPNLLDFGQDRIIVKF